MLLLTMENNTAKWWYLVILAIVWGSSFILIKKSLIALTPIQLGAFRVFISGVFLIIIGFKHLKVIRKHHWKWLITAGFLGTFFPAFCFAYAQTEIDSAVTSILNATTPIMTLIFGLLFFKVGFSARQIIGVLIGLTGCFLLIWQGAEINAHQDYRYVLFIFIATWGYAMNVNILKSRLEDLPSVTISTASFLAITFPAFIILLFSGFFTKLNFSDSTTLYSIGAATILAIFSSALALLLFNKLIKMTTAVFSASVTYLIPVIALVWGIFDGEKFMLSQIAAACIILFGVILSNTHKRKV